jgi:hypothetical protein
VDKTCKSVIEWRSAESKSKKQSFLYARENEKLQDAMLDVRLGRASSTTHLHLVGTGQQQAAKDKESAKVCCYLSSISSVAHSKDKESAKVCCYLRNISNVVGSKDKEGECQSMFILEQY